MAANDLDATDAVHYWSTVVQDQELVRMAREDVNAVPQLLRRRSKPARVRCVGYQDRFLVEVSAKTRELVHARLELPIPLGARLVLKSLPTGFHKVDDFAEVEIAFAGSSQWGQTRIAYNAIPYRPITNIDRWGRLWTYEQFARNFPAPSITMVFLAREFPEDVLGQQLSFIHYLTLQEIRVAIYDITRERSISRDVLIRILLFYCHCWDIHILVLLILAPSLLSWGFGLSLLLWPTNRPPIFPIPWESSECRKQIPVRLVLALHALDRPHREHSILRSNQMLIRLVTLAEPNGFLEPRVCFHHLLPSWLPTTG